jgi:hypothetical protein
MGEDTLLDFGLVEDKMQGIIKVIGVGGRGCNAVRNMFELMVVAKAIVDMVRTHNPGRCMAVALCFFVGIEAVTMLAIECIEGNIYIFIPVVFIFATVSVHYKKKQER